MRPQMLIVLVAGLLLAADAPKKDAAQGDRDKVQGTWTVLTLIDNGKTVPPEKVKGAKLTFEGDRYKLTGAEENFSGTFRLDPAQKPKAIDTTFVDEEGKEKGKALGIYEFDGDRLKVCWRHGGKDRPKDFASTPDSRNRLMVLERVKR